MKKLLRLNRHYILDTTLDEIDEKQELGFMQNKDYFLNKDDKIELTEKIGEVKSELTEKMGDLKSELTTSIYIAGLVQLSIIIGSLFGYR